jgi:phosphate-selective porin OprO/OprP
MSVGKQKPPMSMERITSLVYIPMQERSAVSDTLMPSRKNGVAFNGFNEGNTTSLSIGAFNNWASNKYRGFNDSETSLTGRFTWAPFISEDESNILHLGFAYSHTNGKEGFNFSTTPEFNKSPVFAGTGEHDADKIQTYNLELYWRKDRLWLGGEYTRTKVSNPDLLNPTFDGYHLNASWVLTGKMRTYNKRNGVFRAIPVAKDVYEHGKGAWEIAMRYSDLDLNDGLVEGGDLQIFSAGLNWWLTTGFAFSLNYRYINNGQFDLDGNSTGLNARLLLMLN